MSLDKLSDDPLPSTAQTVIPFTPEVRNFLLWLEDLLEREECQYAADTLEGIRSTITRVGVISDAQRQAVENIHLGSLKAQERKDDLPSSRGGSRRYEGYGR